MSFASIGTIRGRLFQPVGGGTPFTSITGGGSFDLVITLDSITTSALSVTVSVDNAALLNGSWPATVIVPANTDSVHLTISTRTVSNNDSVTFTLTANGDSVSDTLAVTAQSSATI